MKRAINFAAGPAKLPEAVLLKAQGHVLHYGGLGIGMLEISHRSPAFMEIVKTAENNLRDLLSIPDNYKVLFLQGGGCGQFTSVPLNLTTTSGPTSGISADYIVTGNWSNKSAQEARKYLHVNHVLPKENRKYTSVPDQSTWTLSKDASYVYYCDNETIHGVEFPFVPDVPNGVPLVCDMSSNILSKPVDISKYGLIFAGAQKNIGTPGVTVMIVREDLIKNEKSPLCPSIWDFKLQLDNNSLYNTPSTFSIYIMHLVFEWLKEQGGVKRMEELSKIKSDSIYATIDSSNGFYFCPLDKNVRSRMNIPFRIGGAEGNADLEKMFMDEAKKSNMVELKGHRNVGGLRVSLYNAVTVDETKLLAEFMQDFAQKHNK